MFKIKRIGKGEPKLRLDLALSIYLIGASLRVTVYHWEITADIGRALLRT